VKEQHNQPILVKKSPDSQISSEEDDGQFEDCMDEKDDFKTPSDILTTENVK
jgi:hypothetical protein